jgi:phosphatidylglycerol lysyltransferase
MKDKSQSLTFSYFIKERSIPFIVENRKIIAQFIFTFLFLGLGIWFIKHGKAEIYEVKNVLSFSSASWISVGIALTVVYVLLMGLMYVFAFKSIGCKVRIKDTSLLFLKRNVISVFLPAGGLSSLAFFTGPIEKRGITKTQIHFASSIYGFVSILSVVIVAIPAFIYAIIKGNSSGGDWIALSVIIIILSALVVLYYSVARKGRVFGWLIKLSPSLEIFLEDLINHRIDTKYFYLTLFLSILVEILGIVHVYIAMIALHIQPLLFAAVMGYIIAVIFLLASPFLRGLGAIEVSMALIFSNFGFSDIDSIAITFLFRFFEFWLPLFLGIISFLNKANKFLMRLIPALLLFFMGIINILSFLTPAIRERNEWLEKILILDVINASNYFVVIAGVFLLVTAAFLLKGLRTAWWLAILLVSVSLIGHLTRNVDYEDALIAFVIIIILWATRKQYYIKSNTHFYSIGLKTSLYSIAAVLVYGIVGFYSFDKRYFGTNFSLYQSIKYTIENYFLVGSSELVSLDSFARHFLLTIHISGFITFSFFIFILIRPYVIHSFNNNQEIETARKLLRNFGKSCLDYFKTYSDKLIFVSSDSKGFVGYRIASNFAVVLENPVAENEHQMKKCVAEFNLYCYENSLKSIYYRVPEESLATYKELGKNVLYIGQEAIIELSEFNIESKGRESLQQSIALIKDKGYTCHVHTPPVTDEVLEKIESVSNNWLAVNKPLEITFSQGKFVWEELKNQTILTVENAENKTIAFLNIIPDFTKNESTYDLIRKTNDTIDAVLDYMLIELFNYLKTQDIKFVNMGFAAMSGMTMPQNFPERSMKFAYDKIGSFTHFKGLREYKERFDPIWKNKYLIYDHDYDLLQIPSVLSKVIKP